MNGRPLAVLFLAMILNACASVHDVRNDYRQKIGSTPSVSKRTVVFFLFDGLPISTLTAQLNKNKLPNIEHFFLNGKKTFYRARTTFPSLTFPAIASLLTEEDVDQNGLFGNTMLHNGERLNFDKLDGLSSLNSLIEDHNVFRRIGQQGMRSVSIDYAFHGSATAFTSSADADALLALVDKKYDVADAKSIDSLRLLLRDTPVDQWPDFIFVHLVGVDLTSHDVGPDSPKVTAYLQLLDKQLRPIFVQLSQAEGRRQIIGMLSADHGFDQPIRKVVPLAEVFHDAEFRVLNEGRYLGVYFPRRWSPADRTRLLSGLSTNPDIDIVAAKMDSQIEIRTAQLNTTVIFQKTGACPIGYALSVQPMGPVLASSQWQCPDQLNEATNTTYYPYFISDISHYFQTAETPDAVIITKPGVSFLPALKGQHGGPTPQELFVPLLMHGATLPEGSAVPALKDLLKFIGEGNHCPAQSPHC